MKKQIPNFLTCINLAIGCIGIYYIFTENESLAFYFVIVAGFFDFLDGFLARLLRVQSQVGKQLDSLADLVSFGLLPAIFLLQFLQEKSDYFWIAIFIVIFSAIRLAIFNIVTTQTVSFRGLPTPANAIMLTSLVFFPFELHEYSLIGICLFSTVMLVLPIRLLALKFSSFSWKGNEARWVLIFGSIVLFIIFQKSFIPFLIPFYILISIFTKKE